MLHTLKHLTFYILHSVFYIALAWPAHAAQGLFGLEETARRAGLKSEVAGPATALGVIAGYALAFIGVIFFILMVYGGILWMTARGSEEVVRRAQEIIKAAIAGIIIVFLSYAITQFVLSRLTAAVGV